MQNHLVPKIMLQNLAVILRQFNYGKNSFTVLVPDHTVSDPKSLTRYLLASAVVGEDEVEDRRLLKHPVNLLTQRKRTCLKVEHMKP